MADIRVVVTESRQYANDQITLYTTIMKMGNDVKRAYGEVLSKLSTLKHIARQVCSDVDIPICNASVSRHYAEQATDDGKKKLVASGWIICGTVVTVFPVDKVHDISPYVKGVLEFGGTFTFEPQLSKKTSDAVLGALRRSLRGKAEQLARDLVCTETPLTIKAIEYGQRVNYGSGLCSRGDFSANTDDDDDFPAELANELLLRQDSTVELTESATYTFTY